MKKNKAGGYYKYYNADGKWCRVKIDGNIDNDKVILYIKTPKDERGYLHMPNKTFRDGYHVINYVCKNLDTNGLVVVVTVKG